MAAGGSPPVRPQDGGTGGTERKITGRSPTNLRDTNRKARYRTCMCEASDSLVKYPQFEMPFFKAIGAEAKVC